MGWTNESHFFWLEWQSGNSSEVENTGDRVNLEEIYVHFQSFRVRGTCRSKQRCPVRNPYVNLELTVAICVHKF